MARHIKVGLDYFPLNTSTNDSVELLKAEFGMKGYGILIELFQSIYGGKGYYVLWTEEVELLFARKIGLPAGDNCVSEVVKCCLRRDIFNRELFDQYSILTSEGIQERYLEAIKRRTEINLIVEYILLSADNSTVNACTNIIYANINSKNDYISTQSKVKESKQKKRKINKSSEESPKSIIKNFTTNNELLELLQEFNGMRSKIKKPITTARAMRDGLNDLEKLSKDVSIQIKIVKQSIDCCWLKFYPYKGEEEVDDFDSKDHDTAVSEEDRQKMIEEINNLRSGE